MQQGNNQAQQQPLQHESEVDQCEGVGLHESGFLDMSGGVVPAEVQLAMVCMICKLVIHRCYLQWQF